MAKRAHRSLAPDAPNAPAVEAAYAAAPPQMVVEIIDGQLHTFPRPRPLHSVTEGAVNSRLFDPFHRGVGGPGGWIILTEPELHLGRKPDKISPDLAGWRRERLPPNLFDDDGPAALTIPPDWVCEILSEKTERIDRGKKMRIYRRERVGHVWLINPSYRTLEIYRFEEGRWILVDTYEGEETIRAEPFDAIELSLEALWAR